LWASFRGGFHASAVRRFPSGPLMGH